MTIKKQFQKILCPSKTSLYNIKEDARARVPYKRIKQKMSPQNMSPLNMSIIRMSKKENPYKNNQYLSIYISNYTHLFLQNYPSSPIIIPIIHIQQMHIPINVVAIISKKSIKEAKRIKIVRYRFCLNKTGQFATEHAFSAHICYFWPLTSPIFDIQPPHQGL